jgi:hypothetical protein
LVAPGFAQRGRVKWMGLPSLCSILYQALIACTSHILYYYLVCIYFVHVEVVSRDEDLSLHPHPSPSLPNNIGLAGFVKSVITKYKTSITLTSPHTLHVDSTWTLPGMNGIY